MPVISKDFPNSNLVISLVKELDIIPKYFPKQVDRVDTNKKMKNFVNNCNKPQLTLALLVEIHEKLKGNNLNEDIVELAGTNFAHDKFAKNMRHDVSTKDFSENITGVLQGMTSRVDSIHDMFVEINSKTDSGQLDSILDKSLENYFFKEDIENFSLVEKMIMCLSTLESHLKLTESEKKELKFIVPDEALDGGLIEITKHLAKMSNRYVSDLDPVECEKLDSLCSKYGIEYVDLGAKTEDVLISLVDAITKHNIGSNIELRKEIEIMDNHISNLYTHTVNTKEVEVKAEDVEDIYSMIAEAEDRYVAVQAGLDDMCIDLQKLKEFKVHMTDEILSAANHLVNLRDTIGDNAEEFKVFRDKVVSSFGTIDESVAKLVVDINANQEITVTNLNEVGDTAHKNFMNVQGLLTDVSRLKEDVKEAEINITSLLLDKCITNDSDEVNNIKSDIIQLRDTVNFVEAHLTSGTIVDMATDLNSYKYDCAWNSICSGANTHSFSSSSLKDLTFDMFEGIGQKLYDNDLKLVTISNILDYNKSERSEDIERVDNTFLEIDNDLRRHRLRIHDLEQNQEQLIKTKQKVVDVENKVYTLEQQLNTKNRVTKDKLTNVSFAALLVGCWLLFSFGISAHWFKRNITDTTSVQSEQDLLQKFSLPNWQFTHNNHTVYVYRLKAGTTKNQYRSVAVHKGKVVSNYFSINPNINKCIEEYKKNVRILPGAGK